MTITRKSEWLETKFELFIKKPCLGNNICENKYDWSQHNSHVRGHFKKYVKRYDMGHASHVSYHKVASVVPGVRYWKLAVRLRGTSVANVCLLVIGCTLKVSPI